MSKSIIFTFLIMKNYKEEYDAKSQIFYENLINENKALKSRQVIYWLTHYMQIIM